MRQLAGNTGADAMPRPLVAAVCGVQFVDVLGVAVVITALPTMLADLDAGVAEGSFVVTAYAMFFGGPLLAAARMGDRVGHRRIVLGALALFAVASIVAALAPTIWWLVAARALQGLSAAASVPAAMRLLTTLVPAGAARRRAVAWWSAAGAVAGVSGFAVGGVVTDIASWRAVFWLNLVLAGGLAAAILGAVRRDGSTERTGRFGWPSAIWLTGGAMGVVVGATLFGEHQPVVVATAITGLGLVMAAAFVVTELQGRHPLVPIPARRSPALRWGAAGSFGNGATVGSSIAVATVYLQEDLGAAPIEAAALLAPCSLLVLAGSLVAPRLLAIGGWAGTLAAGFGTIALGSVVLVAWPQAVGVATGAAISGLGLGIGSVAANDLGTQVDPATRATAAGALNTAAQLGIAVGTAVMLMIATQVQPRVAWAVVAAFAAATAVVTARRAPGRDVGDRPTKRVTQLV